MDNLFQNKYRVPSARATWHEYDGGAYFVTICTERKVHFFGEITNGEMQLTEIGQYAYDNFANVSAHYPYAEIPLFVVMPNHIHAIVFINNDCKNNNSGDCRDAINRVSTDGGITALRNPMLQNCLGAVIRGIKARISRCARQRGIPFAWQPRYYDHIIRNYHETNQIAEYIENNVARWDLDELYG